MPNWCDNSLSVYGQQDAINEFFERVSALGDEQGISILESFIPTPKALIDDGDVPSMTDDDKAALEKDYGTWDWYTWRLTNWGCKWSDTNTHVYTNAKDRSSVENPLVDSFYCSAQFQTPWAPPEPAIQTISGMFPKLTFVISYVEEGMGFYGAACFIAGELAGEAGGQCEDIDGYDALLTADDGEPDHDAIHELISFAREQAETMVRI